MHGLILIFKVKTKLAQSKLKMCQKTYIPHSVRTQVRPSDPSYQDYVIGNEI